MPFPLINKKKRFCSDTCRFNTRHCRCAIYDQDSERSSASVGEARLARGGGGVLDDYAHCSVSRGTEERGIRFTLHAFGGGCRILVEEWGKGEDRALWLAPLDEERVVHRPLLRGGDPREIPLPARGPRDARQREGG